MRAKFRKERDVIFVQLSIKSLSFVGVNNNGWQQCAMKQYEIV